MKTRIPICLIALVFSTAVNQAAAQVYYDTSIPNPLYQQNGFVKQKPSLDEVPDYQLVKSKMPVPFWSGRKEVIDCYWKAWELAFRNVKKATAANRFVQPYISPAFNDHIFMWDTSFMVMFGRYGRNAFNFQGSLDNFYSNQHKDGYITREISELNGAPIFEKFDPSSTGPNLMPWAEWDYYQFYRDQQRLAKIFPVLLAYYEWLQQNRTWQDGSYFASGWSCGMDNQPRVPKGYHLEFSTGMMSWVDATLQQVFAAKLLLKMAKVLHRETEVTGLHREVTELSNYVQTRMWDNKTGYLYDRFRDGTLSDVKSIASYWALLAEVVPANGLERFIAHLENPREFKRRHRIPALSADNKDYKPDGNYWQGGVWAPTNYMVLRGLSLCGKDSLAYEIARNHLDNVVKVYEKTGTLWENYAPDVTEGKYRKDMVGWSGLTPISILFEYVFGISADKDEGMIVWDIRLTDEFGLKNYPVAGNGLVDFWCGKRKSTTDKPVIRIHASTPVTIKVIWKGGSKILKIKPKS